MAPYDARRICAKGGTTPGAYSWQAQVRELPIPTGQTSADPEKKGIRDEEAGDARDLTPLPTCSDVNESRPMYVTVQSAITPGTILGAI
jgi:hypothetical protein